MRFRKALPILAEIIEVLHEADIWHPDAKQDLRHDPLKRAIRQPGQHPNHTAPKCPPGHVRNNKSGKCEPLRGSKRY